MPSREHSNLDHHWRFPSHAGRSWQECPTWVKPGRKSTRRHTQGQKACEPYSWEDWSAGCLTKMLDTDRPDQRWPWSHFANSLKLSTEAPEYKCLETHSPSLCSSRRTIPLKSRLPSLHLNPQIDTNFCTPSTMSHQICRPSSLLGIFCKSSEQQWNCWMEIQISKLDPPLSRSCTHQRLPKQARISWQ